MNFSICSLRTLLYEKRSRVSPFRNFSHTLVNRRQIYKYPRLSPGEVLQNPRDPFTVDDELYNSLKGKVLYNCAVSKKNSAARWQLRKQLLERINPSARSPSIPLSLKYMCGDSVYEFDEYKNTFEGLSHKESSVEHVDTNDEVYLPYDAAKRVELQSDTESDQLDQKEDDNISEIRRRKIEQEIDVEPYEVLGKKWMSDYEVFEEGTSDVIEEMGFPRENYGTADPNVMPTKIPCGGCGAHLHCQNSSVPGFLPKEIFLKCTKEDFHRLVCQRCTFLKHYNIALSVFVDPDMYPKLLSSLKHKNCCLIVMVDMTDFPCSIWPNLLDVVGYEKPIILVGNKIDLVPGDSPGWLNHAEKTLRANFPKEANVLSTCLISAKTGFGVEDLITKLHTKWRKNGDVYLVGCTNVGKSSLFNVLISSDYCRSKAADLMQRATVSPWPGTTLNLLKFPIMRLEGWRAYLRNQRLKKERFFLMDERRLEKLQNSEDKIKTSPLPKITGEVGRTFQYRDPKKDNTTPQEFVLPKLTHQFINSDERPFLNPNDKDFINSKWCYDTPGVVHRDQIIDLLTTEELNILMRNSLYYPRIFSVYTGQTLFVGGLARLDHLESDGGDFIRCIVYSSGILPVTVCRTEAAEEVYETLLGSRYFKIPVGSAKRLEKWPTLKSVQDFEIVCEGNARNSSEIVLSSAGWVSFNGRYGVKSKVRPWTPAGRGIHLREPPILRLTHRQRRTRVSGTPTYHMKYL